MIVLVKLDGPEYAKINALVKEGKYPSIESFVELAVRNQLLLETGEKLNVEKNLVQSAATPVGSSLSVPFRSPKTLELPNLDDIRRSFLWGQVNRLAPAKFVLRFLLNIQAASDGEAVDLNRFSAEVADKASKFRVYAKKKDKVKRVRGEYLYVGFPKRSPSSQQRFLNYYVGKSPLQKWTDSIIVGLSLANIKETADGSRVIGLTEHGLKFAKLESPLIDKFFLKTRQTDTALSIEEVTFLVNHIKLYRPGEFEFMKFVLESVHRGADTPIKLKDKVFEYLKNKDLGMQLSEKVANTMQVGVIGRLVELRLLKIEKKAQKSRYIITEKTGDLIGKL